MFFMMELWTNGRLITLFCLRQVFALIFPCFFFFFFSPLIVTWVVHICVLTYQFTLGYRFVSIIVTWLYVFFAYILIERICGPIEGEKPYTSFLWAFKNSCPSYVLNGVSVGPDSGV